MDRTLANAARKLKRANRLPAIWWMSDESAGDPRVVARALPRGSAVVLRHYGAAARAALARDLAAVCRRHGLALIVAGDWRLAARVDAAGCHLPEHAAGVGPAPGLRLWRRRKCRLLTAAAHGGRALRRARAIGADAAMLSPVFATPRYPARRALGAMRTAMLARTARLPVVALGGITRLTARALRGVSGIAGIGFGLR